VIAQTNSNLICKEIVFAHDTILDSVYMQMKSAFAFEIKDVSLGHESKVYDPQTRFSALTQKTNLWLKVNGQLLSVNGGYSFSNGKSVGRSANENWLYLFFGSTAIFFFVSILFQKYFSWLTEPETNAPAPLPLSARDLRRANQERDLLIDRIRILTRELDEQPDRLNM